MPATRGIILNMRLLRTACAATTVLAATLLGLTSTQAVTPSATTPCGVAAHPPTRFDHVVWVVFENKERASVIGSPSAPYLTGLAKRCGNAGGMVAETHPSLPNYLWMTSGSGHGVTDDKPPSAHPISGPSIFSIIGDWRSLQEGMRSNCALVNGGVRYAVKHNPGAYYTGLRAACKTRDVPYNISQTPDLRARFTFVIPDMCHSMHDCSVGTGDAWAKTFLTKVLNSPQYAAGRTAVFVTFDENDGSPGNEIPTIVITPSVKPGTVVTTRFNHCNLQRTTERMLQNPGPYTYAGCANGSTSMRPAFNS